MFAHTIRFTTERNMAQLHVREMLATCLPINEVKISLIAYCRFYLLHKATQRVSAIIT